MTCCAQFLPDPDIYHDCDEAEPTVLLAPLMMRHVLDY